MEVYVTDDRIGRYFRRIQLGLRFLAHGARTQTTSQWSGLTADQLVTLRRRWMFNAKDRLRGPSPTSFQPFFRSSKARAQAALFVCICRGVGALPRKCGKYSARAVVSLENGERLCEAFEIFREWEPDGDIEFEQAVLLLIGVAEAEKIELARCPSCPRMVLIDNEGNKMTICARCRKEQPRSPSKPASCCPHGSSGAAWNETESLS